MNVKLLAVIITTPKIGKNLRAFLDRVSYHLSTGYLCTIFHNKGSNVLGAAFVKAQYPYFLVLPALAVVCELTFIYFNCSAHLTQLITTIMILKVDVDKLTNPSVDIVNITVL